MPDIRARSLALLTRRLMSRQEADAALLARYTSANDSAAFAELVRRHGPTVLGVCRRMLGHHHDADDAFQAIFLIFARSARSVRKPQALSAWLYGTAIRVCRKALATRTFPRPLPTTVESQNDPFAEVAWKEVRGLLDEEVGRLPEALRAPLLLCYFGGLTRDEAAAQLGCSRRTLMRRLEQGRTRLRRGLERRGIGHVGFGAAVLAHEGFLADVPDSLLASALAVANGGPVSAVARLLAGLGGSKLLCVLVGLVLVLVTAVGLCGLGSPSVADPSEIPNPPTQDERQSLDADGRKLPAGAVRRLGSRRYRVEGRSHFVLPTPDGRHLLVQPQPSLSSYAAQGLMLLDIDTGFPVRSFEDSRRVPKVNFSAAIRPAAFSADGKTLYGLGWHKSEAQDWSHVWADFDNPCRRVVLVWDVATGKCTAEWDLPHPWSLLRSGGTLLGLEVSPDGKRLYVFGSIRMTSDPVRCVRGLHVLDTTTGRKLQTWEGAGNPAGTIANGKELITFRDGAPITAHDVSSGKPVRTFPLAGFVPSVAVSADGKTIGAVAIAGESGKRTCEIKLWDAASGREIRRLSADAQAVGFRARLVLPPDGKTLYLGAASGRILRWDLTDGRALPDISAHGDTIADMFWRPGKNEILSAGTSDGAIRRWDPATGKNLSATNAYMGETRAVPTPDRHGVVVIDGTGRLDVWDLSTGKVTMTLRTPGRKHHELLFTPNGKQLLVAAQSGLNTIWDWPAGKQAGTWEPPPKIDTKAEEYWWATLGFSPDGRHLIGAKFGRGTWMWSWPDRKVLWHEPKEQECNFFPDGQTLVCAPWHGAIEVRDPLTGAVKRTLPGTGLTHVVYSHDRRRMVTAHLEGTWKVRDAATAALPLKEVKAFQHAWCLAVSPTGWLLAVAGDNAVRVYDTATWQEVARFDGHNGTVRNVFFGPDDWTLVSASAEDGTALVWSLKTKAGVEAPQPAKLWADLAGSGPAVLRAVCAAAQHPEVAVPMFRAKWPVPQGPADVRHIRKLIRELEAEAFADRESAEAELSKTGRPAEPELQKALSSTTSAEVKRRLQRILDTWAPPAGAEYPAAEARELRAVWALELAGTPEAKQLLEAWASAKVGSRLCEQAAAALKRLRNHKE
jgi:RNA polymerase sigma factor (sigma-70 family)